MCIKYPQDQRDVTNNMACHINCPRHEGTYSKHVNTNTIFIGLNFYARNSNRTEGLCRNAQGRWKNLLSV